MSVGLTAEVEPLPPGQGIASGTVKFMVKKKTLGTLALRGSATLTPQINRVLSKADTVVSSGDRNFQPSQAATPVPTRASLRSLAWPIIALVERMSPFSFTRFGSHRHE